jgi:uncharacterized membrane protein
MNLRSFYQVSAIVIVAQLTLAAYGLWLVGPDAQVPVHWGVGGEADGWATALVGFAILPLVTAAIVALFAAVPRIEPRRRNLERSASAYRTTATAIVLFLGVAQGVVVFASLGDSLPMTGIIGFGIGLLFIVMGNVLATVRSNFMFGVRTPWTLSSDLAWDRTNRLVGRLFVLAGVSLIALTPFGNAELVVWIMVAWIVVLLVVGLAYSYHVWKADPDRRARAGENRTAEDLGTGRAP